MATLRVTLFKESFGPFLNLLNEHKVQYRMQGVRSGISNGPNDLLEILGAVGNAAIWASLAAVVVAYLKGRQGRKVIITTKENTVVHAEGLSVEEVERVLDRAFTLTVIDPNKDVVDAEQTTSAKKHVQDKRQS